MTSPAPTVTGPQASTSRGRPVITLTPTPAPIPPSRSLRGTMPGSLVARLAGGHFKEARRVPFGDQALGRWKMHGTLAPFSIASVVGATEEIRSCCAASVRDPALDGERHGGATSLGAPAARRFCITAAAAGCRPSIDVRCFAPILPLVPVRLLILTPKLNQLDARTSPIFQARRGNSKGPRRRRDMPCFGCLFGRAAQTGAGMGAISSPILTTHPRAASTTSCMMRVAALFLCGLRILPRSWAHLALTLPSPVPGSATRKTRGGWPARVTRNVAGRNCV